MPVAPDIHIADRLRLPLLRCASGESPSNLALMEIFAAAENAHAAAAALAGAIADCERNADQAGAARLRRAVDLWASVPDAYSTVTEVLAIERDIRPKQPESALARIESVFDRLAEHYPEAGVALYSLGSRDLLSAATREVAERMREWGCLGPDRVLLDVGCGFGRCTRAIAAEAALVVGLDLSMPMLQIARQHCAGIPRTAFIRVSGRGLSPFAAASVDAVYAVDSFPYVVAAGSELVAAHMADAHDVLKPGGTLLILNFSYSGNPERDRADIAALASRFGFAVHRNGTRDFSLWDAVTFQLIKT